MADVSQVVHQTIGQKPGHQVISEVAAGYYNCESVALR